MSEVTLPYRYKPRQYQFPLWNAIQRGVKRIVVIWHRRSGKDKTIINIIATESQKRVGTYYYFFPTYAQGKKILWDGVDKDGFPFMSHFPKEIVKNKNETELRIEFLNGSAFQIIGTDKIDSIVGTNPIGCVFSEYALQDPKAWEMMRPILRENGGFAIFNFTPRGMNHGHKILQVAINNPDTWFYQVLTVDDTNAVTPADIEQERKEGMPEELIQQEYYCKFIEGAGAFFKRVRDYAYDPDGLALNNNGDFQVGADFAKHQDWTVLTPFCLNSFVMYPQERFNQIEWNLQKSRVEAMCFRHQNVEGSTALLWPDSTGVGDPIVEDLKSRGLRIGNEGEGFKFTETSRTQLLDNLRILIEQGKIRIPNDEGLIGELQSMRYELSERGKIKIKVPDGMTDDRIMSAALSVWGITAPIKPDYDFMSRVLNNRVKSKSFK